MISQATDSPVAKLPKTHYVDNSIYTDDEIFELEKQNIFSKIWTFVCLESEVREAGDYRVVELAGGISVIISRQKDGSLSAFYNVCSHRGAKLTELPSGNSKFFQCPYHLWTFHTDGKLRGVTRPEAYEGTGFCREALDLTKVRVESVYGLIYVCLDPDAGPLKEFLGEEVLEHLKGPLGTEELEVFHYHRAVIHANWKHWNDNNSELYHEWLHYLNRKTTKAMTGETDQRWMIYGNGHHVIRSAGGQETQSYEAANIESRDKHLFPTIRPNEFLLANLFPDVMVNLRATVLRMDRMVPLSPGKTLIEWRGIGLKSDSDEVRRMRVRHHNIFWGPHGRNIPEDIIAVESQRDAMVSGGLKYSIYAREEQLKPQDDANVRDFYVEWGKRTGVDPSDPKPNWKEATK